jgi:hypothetical protein
MDKRRENKKELRDNLEKRKNEESIVYFPQKQI